MYPCRIKYPKVGDEIIFFDDSFTFTDNEKLTKFDTYIIKKIVPGTGMTFTLLEGCGNWLYNLSDFVRPDDILLRKYKLEKINDRNRKSGKRIQKVF